MRFMRIFGKLYYFFDDVISGQDDVITFRFSMEVEILGWSFGQKNFGSIGPTSCLLNLWLDPLLFRFQPLKKPTFQWQIHQPNLFFHQVDNAESDGKVRYGDFRWWNDTLFIFFSRLHGPSPVYKGSHIRVSPVR